MVSGFAGGSNSWFRKVRCCLLTQPIPFGRWPSSDPASPAHLPPRGRLFSGGTTLQSCTALTEPSPRGKVAAKQTDEGHAAQALRSVPTQNATPQKRDRPQPVSFSVECSSRSQRSPLWLTFPARSSRGCRAGRSTARTWCWSCS